MRSTTNQKLPSDHPLTVSLSSIQNKCSQQTDSPLGDVFLRCKVTPHSRSLISTSIGGWQYFSYFSINSQLSETFWLLKTINFRNGTSNYLFPQRNNIYWITILETTHYHIAAFMFPLNCRTPNNTWIKLCFNVAKIELSSSDPKYIHEHGELVSKAKLLLFFRFRRKTIQEQSA